MADFLTDKPTQLERAFLVGVQTEKMAEGEGAELLLELKELVENLRLDVTRTTLVNLRRPNPALLLGSGKAEELAALAKADGADVIVFDEALSPAQQRNWEELSGLAVIDRQEVILEIFADRAHTREAILQVALARMDYALVGWGFNLWDFDWFRRRDPERIARRIASKAPPGGIVVIHDGHHENPRADRRYAVETVRLLIPKLRAAGFSFGRICGEDGGVADAQDQRASAGAGRDAQ